MGLSHHPVFIYLFLQRTALLAGDGHTHLGTHTRAHMEASVVTAGVPSPQDTGVARGPLRQARTHSAVLIKDFNRMAAVVCRHDGI